MAQEMGLINSAYLNKALTLLNLYEMNYAIPANIDKAALLNAMSLDKKVQQGKIRFILPTDAGKVEIFDSVDENIILNALNKLF
ncbi:MAG: hypothetical protein M0C28_39700 [Candidatus Moduliflexus flocculans]|nr:hypothetical protein [Candidatus Moduliflexus flocculans]